jgi:MFS family permease
MESPNRQSKKNIYILGFVSLFTDVSSQMINPLIPQFLTSLGASTSLIGIIEGIAESTASIFKTYFGRLSDKIENRKKFILLGYSLSAISKPFLFLSTIWGHVLLVKFTERMGKAMRSPARDALIASSVPQEKRGEAFGFHRSMDRAGALLGPLIALVVLYFAPNNIRLVFLLAGIPAFIAILFIPFSKEIKISLKSSNKETKKSLASNQTFIIFLIGNIVFSLGNSSNAFLLLKATEVGITISVIPLLWMSYNFVSMISAPLFGKISDKIGRAPIISLSFLWYCIIYLGFSFFSDQLSIWLLFMAYGIYYGLSAGVYKAYISDLVSSDKRGTAFGIFETAIGLALLPASIITGYVWELFGSSYAFMISSIFSLLGFVIVLISFWSKNRAKKIY